MILPEGITRIGTGAFLEAGLENVTIPQSVTEIKDGAFNTTCLSSVFIPKNVSSIGANPFRSCTNVKSIQVDNDNTVYSDDGGKNVIMKKDTGELIAGCSTSVLSENIKTIGDMAFCGYGNLERIVIPESVTKIGILAFADCYKLTIYGVKGSVAETYAKEANIPFVEIASKSGNNASQNTSGQVTDDSKSSDPVKDGTEKSITVEKTVLGSVKNNKKENSRAEMEEKPDS